MRITNDLPHVMTVNWNMTTTCNYACWYCPDSLHDGKHRWPDLETSLRFFHGLCSTTRHVHLSMAGGEPTLWPDLDNFLRDKPGTLGVEVGSNGSRTIGWWKRNFQHMDGASLSYHPDTADPDHMYDLCSTIAAFEDKLVHLDIMLVWDRIDECLDLYQRLHDSGLAMSCRFKTIDHWKSGERDRIIANGDHCEISWIMENMNFVRNKGSYAKPSRAWLDGVQFDKYLLPSENRNGFEGWICSAGRNRLHIDPNGDIYRGTCMNGGKVGHISDYATVADLGRTICRKKSCGCLDEIILEKHAIYLR